MEQANKPAEPTRQPHAALDLRSRRAKGLKIERLLDLQPSSSPIRILEIGTGSGGIANYFATHPSLNCKVTSLDVVDQRQIKDGYEFMETEGTALPFEDASFDVVMTNHVIEHVGNRSNQMAHLEEVRRVMHKEGIGYLAVPNRWMLIEPHYRLAFLSWWPRGWRSAYLRLMRHGRYYDCLPLQLGELNRMLEETGLKYTHLEVEAFHQIIAIEGKGGLTVRLASRLPDRLLAAMRPVIPTLICKLTHA